MTRPLNMQGLIKRPGLNGTAAPKRRNAQPEAALQRAVVDAFGMMQLDALWFAVPNGGQRSRIEAAIMAGLGVKPGIGDLCLIWQRHEYGDGGFIDVSAVGFIELKALGGKPRLRAEQAAFARDCGRYGIRYGIAQSLDEVDALLAAWGVPRRRDITGRLLF